MVGVGAGGFASTLEFSDATPDADIQQYSVAASAGYRFSHRLSVRLTAGAILGGELETVDRTFDVGPGFLLSGSVSRRWDIGRWFLAGTLSAGVSRTTTEEAGVADAPSVELIASDARVAALFGTTVADRVSPYVLARGFGGPVFWSIDGEDSTGTDAHHYQLGAGGSVALPANVSAQIDVSFLGERSLSAGAAVAF